MKIEKMSFKNIKDVLSRDEMKKIMAGSGTESWRCTETWQGWNPVVRDCYGGQSGCSACIMTGSGCTVTCVSPF